MNDLEESLRRLRQRPLPASWRRKILAQCESTVREPRFQWRDWLWPSPFAWGALAVIWVGLIAWNMGGASAGNRSSIIANKEGATKPSRAVFSWQSEWQDFLAQNR